MASFVQEVKNETKKVTWPSKKETWVTTLMVFIMVFLVAMFLFGVDQVVSYMIQLILGLGS